MKNGHILFLDDMNSSHVLFQECIDQYNVENSTDFEVDHFTSITEMKTKAGDKYFCSVVDWNLNSNIMKERGDVAAHLVKDISKKVSIITRMFDEPEIKEFCTHHGYWLMEKTGDITLMYKKVKEYIDHVLSK